MFNAGVRGKRAKDSTGLITVGEHFNQQQYLIPTVTRFAVTDGSYVDTNDIAADTAGNQTIVLYGSGFAPGATVLVGSTTIGAVTFLDSGRLAFASPALGSGSYTVFVTNANGGTGILVPGLVYSGLPTFTTAAGSLGTVYETTAISTSVVATGDAPITYSLSSGSLPAGSTLSSGGTISGTAPVDGSSTTYSFTVQATDAQNQDSVRSFSLTISTDVVSFSTPANNTTTTATQNTAISNVTVVATSAAGYGVLYTSSGLPTGLSMNTSTGIISGTPTIVASNTSIITATANTTTRTASLYLNWTINLPGDLFWKYASLLLSANTVPNGNTFNTDASTINNEVVVVADTKPSKFHPFKEGYYSNFFDNTGDYLTIPHNTALDLWVGDFTIECWVFSNANQSNYDGIITKGGGTDAGWQMVVVSNAVNVEINGSTLFFSPSTTLPNNTWVHLAIVKRGTNVSLFQNGTRISAITGSSSTYSTTNNVYIGADRAAGNFFNGYISNVRLVKGTAVYDPTLTTLTPPTPPLTAIANTSLLTCQSNKLIDNSNNNFTITKNGDTTVSPFSPFNGTPITVTVPAANNYSMYFDGTGDYLDVTGAGNEFVFGTGDFTIELWVHPTIAPSTSWNPILSLGTSGGGQEIRISQNLNGTGYGYLIPNNSNNADVYPNFGTLTLNQWHHLALVRNGSTVTFYRNGVSVGSTTSVSFNFTNTTLYRIGGSQPSYAADGSFGGYISNLRIVKGLPVYTGNFTVPSSPLAITQSSSANTSALAIVPTNGASVYFDGTGDYLTGPSSNSLITTGPFTIELWVWVPSNASNRQLLGNARWQVGGNGGFRVYLLSNGTVSLAASTGTYNTYPNVLVSTTTVTPKTWTHIAFVRNSSNTVSCFINGVSAATPVTYASSLSLSSDGNIGQFTVGTGIYDGSATDFFSGYISNLRLNAGTEVYTGAFTPPTEPLTAIANTKILTCQSKTSTVIDNSTNAFTITKVGDAAVANTFSPFGTTASFLTAQANTVIDNSNNALTITTNGNATPRRNGPFANTTTVTLVGNEGSAYFDGTGDLLTIPNHTSHAALGTSDFTLELWFNQTVLNARDNYLISHRVSGYAPYLFWINSSGSLRSYASTSLGSWDTMNDTALATISLNTWYHLAYTRSGSTFKIFLNGAQVYSFTSSATFTTATTALNIGGQVGGTDNFTGYVSNARFVKGTALYTTPFVPSFAPLTPVANTVLLTAQTNLSSNTKVFVDESNYNNIITGTGNATLGSFSPFGSTWSVYFDGTTDYLTTPASTANQLTGDFTIEFWFYASALTGGLVNINSATGPNSSTGLSIYLDSGGVLKYFVNGNGTIVTGPTITTGVWYHVALVRSGSTNTLYLDGVSRITSATTPAYGLASIGVGRIYNDNTGSVLTGYISNVRILKGTALYTANTSPPTSPLLPIANTIFLSCNSNRFVDYSAANNAITRTGDTSVSRFSPFSPLPVTPASYGVYFDGTGDYLSVPTNSALDFGTGDFTVEGWVLPNSLASDWFIISSSGSGGFFFGFAPGDPTGFGWGRTGVAWDYRVAGNATVGVWQHVAVTRSGTSMRLFVNGTQSGTTQTISTAYNLGTTSTTIGSQGANYYLNGYISNLRVVKGTAVYTANFTPSTTPLTAISGTSLLTCQSTTIIDNSSNAFAITINGDAKPVIQNPFTDTIGTGINYSANTYGSSIFFDSFVAASGDFLSVSGIPIAATGQFTFEAWIYTDTVNGADSQTIYSQYTTSDANRWTFNISVANKLTITHPSLTVTGATTIVPNQWNHVAVTRDSGNTLRIFLNGVVDATSASYTYSIMQSAPRVGYYNNTPNDYFNGYMSSVRVINGQALYTTPFVPSSQPAPVTSNTTLLLASTSGPSVTDALRISNIETTGTARYVANNSPYYDTYSGYFDGTGDYLAINYASGSTIAGDFTWETWVYDIGTRAYATPMAWRSGSSSFSGFIIQRNNGANNLNVSITNGALTNLSIIQTSGTYILNAWNHIAVTRLGSLVTVWVNGISVGTGTLSGTISPGSSYWIGSDPYNNVATVQFGGYISNQRFVNGTAVYTSTFAPPATPLTAIANTSLLTCQSNKFIDNSTNALTITKTGDVKITTLQPFAANNTSRFSSVYFATKTDYLSLSTSYSGGKMQGSLLTFPGDFTFECWVYPTDTTLSTTWGVWDNRQSGSTAAAMIFGLAALASPVTGSWRLTYYNGTFYYGTGTVLWNQWTHVAWVRSGTTMTFYVNGVAGGTATISGTQTGTATSAPIYIGSKDNGLANYGTVGYLSDFRITNGYARTITVPTAPYDIK